MDSTEELFFLLEELGISAGLFYRSLLPTMKDLQSGRSLKAGALEEKLALSEAYLAVLQETLPEFERALGNSKKDPEWAAQLGPLEAEWGFYRKFQSVAEGLMQKLNLIAQAGSLSPLGKIPVQDLWEEIEQLAHHA